MKRTILTSARRATPWRSNTVSFDQTCQKEVPNASVRLSVDEW